MRRPEQEPRGAAPYAAIVPAPIGRGALRQHAVRQLAEGPVFLLAAALGPPRLWAYLLEGALDGFEEGHQRPHDGRVSTRLHQGMLVAQHAVRRRVEALIERRPSDAALLALALDGDVLHVLSCGPLRAYLRSAGVLRRVGPDAREREGLLKRPPTWTSEPVHPADLVLAASPSASGDAALSELTRPDAAGLALPELLARLSGPARERGEAAAALLVRVPVS